MVVGDAGIALWILGLLAVGVVGFVLVLLTMLIRFMAWIFRGITGGCGRRGRSVLPGEQGPLRRLCPHAGCGHANVPTALYCARCGRPLRQTYDVDAYG